MPKLASIQLMPSKLRYKLIIAFSLMSVLPILVGVYVASLFIHFPFEANVGNLATISIVMGTSVFFALLGYQITRQMIEPIIGVAATAKNIASGLLDAPAPEAKGADEIEELSESLKTISTNAKELLERVEKLSQRDKLTGLYNASYIRERLQEEIQRAVHFQRPCSFAYFILGSPEGGAVSEETLKAVAEVLGAHLTQFDRAARIKRNEFALIFPDKNKKKTIEAVLKIKASLGEGAPPVSIGISENPLDGTSGQELFAKAQERAVSARAKGGNHIEAFE
ncbi:MAG TPA: diguanylate cyclase [Candidatus Eisenbacteria bacterium]|jgi:diguanylate cyclase (GGDEF)-like protein|nr:diguanylate cyclase [Candidatus Eisenbacteria bacterium]